MSAENNRTAQKKAWDKYWSSPRLAACIDADSLQYPPVIRQHWERFFTQVPAGGSVVDLGTGNGAIALVALEVSDRLGLDLDIHGVDQAHIDPPRALPELAEQLGRVHFHSHTDSESLPFDTASVAVVSSQYVLEYTDIQATLTEAARVLSPGGRLQVIAHSQDSSVMDQTRTDIADSRLVLEETGTLGHFRQLLEADLNTGSVTPAQRGAFDQAAARLMLEVRRRTPAQARFLTGLLDSLGQVFQARRQRPAEEILDKATQIETEVLAHLERLQDMAQAALTAEQNQQLTEQLSAAGFITVDNESVVDENGYKLGQRLLATRRTA